MNTTAIKPILIVEDSAEDFTALGRAFRKHALQNPVLRCEDGEQALDYLQGQGRKIGWPQTLPAIILLDLNMPGLDGRDVLGAIKGDPSLHSIPVVIFTTSANAKDVATCYQLGANSYLTKPLAYAELEEKVRLIVHYWLEASELPA
ncbi:response regulator [Hymenobacter sp. 5516J-16]|uniref:Response regulator n=1 Tax=Hymenobacter sublimis TaxID=2933777 RepID=A0ABY4J5Y4_9BACT|nr:MULTISPECIES: response regulator [Hymenobacter]UOQ78248.1 response regulator [Hymenobacter sp. 5516J-16]UPL48230.1 response regulator [Hymenobacter sublimis]